MGTRLYISGTLTAPSDAPTRRLSMAAGEIDGCTSLSSAAAALMWGVAMLVPDLLT